MKTDCASPVCAAGREARTCLKETGRVFVSIYIFWPPAISRGANDQIRVLLCDAPETPNRDVSGAIHQEISNVSFEADNYNRQVIASYGRKPLTTIELGVTSSEEAAAMMPAIAPPIPARIKAARAPLLKPSGLVAAERRAHFGAVPC